MPAPAAPPEVVDACSKYAEAECANFKECSRALFDRVYGTDEVCRANVARSCRNALTTPSIGETPGHRVACAEATRTWSCNDRLSNRPPPACTRPPGMLAMGAPCRASSQCGAGLYCGVSRGQVCGTCIPQAQPDGPCLLGANACTGGGACLFTSGTGPGTCVVNRREGEACGFRDFCEAGTSCINGVCAARTGGLDADCSSTSAICDSRQDLYCNQLTRKCERNPPLARPGEPCGTLQDGTFANVNCVPGSNCVAAGGFVRMCLANLSEGATCHPQIGARCDVGLGCIDGKCTVPPVPVCM
jgi:hypothetical protein